MCDTSSWETCSLGLESALDRWSPLASPLPGDSLAFWNMEDIAAESLEAHLGLEHCGVDVAVLHDTSTNMSHSSTITSHPSPALSNVQEASSDEVGAWSDPGDFPL